jgi:hypothetical protein
MKQWVQNIPMKRAGKAENVAGLVAGVDDQRRRRVKMSRTRPACVAAALFAILKSNDNCAKRILEKHLFLKENR